MSTAQSHVLIFSKYPHAGYAKTRLIPAVGAETAAAISRSLTERCLSTVQAYCKDSGARAIVHYASRGDEDAGTLMRNWLAPDRGGLSVDFAPQAAGDLGERLIAAFRASFDDGMGGVLRRKVVVVGVDIPEISEEILAEAFRSLDSHDTVVGPAADGGYYLLGMSAPADGVFADVTWGKPTVFKETQENIAGHGMSMEALKVLRDVDEPTDIPFYEDVLSAGRL